MPREGRSTGGSFLSRGIRRAAEERERQRREEEVARQAAELTRGAANQVAARQAEMASLAGSLILEDFGADPYYVAEQQVAQANLRNASEQEIIDYIRQNYSPMQSRLLDEPELRDALIRAAREGMDPERAMVEIEKTNWWQARTESQRRFDILEKADPVEFQAQIDRRKSELAPRWQEYGVDFDIDQAARDSLRLGYTEEQLRGLVADSLAAESYREGLDVGTQGAAEADELLRIARQEYLTPLPRSTAEEWVIRGLRQGTNIEDEWRSYLASLSEARFGIQPGSGITPGDIVAPLRAIIAEDLEMDPDAIDMLAPEYSGLLQVQREDGTYGIATTLEARQWARRQGRFAGTDSAKQMATDVAEQIGKTMGVWA